MPRWQVRVSHKTLLFARSWVRDAPSPDAIEQQLIESGFDKRYWGFEIHAYAVNGEDF